MFHDLLKGPEFDHFCFLIPKITKTCRKRGGKEALRGGEEGGGKQETEREETGEGARRKKAGGKLKRERSSREGWRGRGRRPGPGRKGKRAKVSRAPAAGPANQQRPREANSCQQEDGRNKHRTVEYPTGTPDGPHPSHSANTRRAWRATLFTKKTHRLFCAFVLAPASFLTFGKVNAGPPQTDIFFGRGGRPPPPRGCS